jgi:hypothetical protein
MLPDRAGRKVLWPSQLPGMWPAQRLPRHGWLSAGISQLACVPAKSAHTVCCAINAGGKRRSTRSTAAAAAAEAVQAEPEGDEVQLAEQLGEAPDREDTEAAPAAAAGWSASMKC